ncbi:hypothetical protein F9K33_07085 [bacterium]|nr:MAG: hypothetical protein F9K33_07085 [bacterium]
MKTTRRILFLLTLLTAPSWVSAQINNYVMLDGINDYINLPGSLSNYTTSSAGTVSMWIRPTGASPTMFYAYEGNSIFADQGGYMGISRGIIGGQDRIWFYNWSGGYSQVGIPYNADEWIHIAWVLEGSYLKAYKNGALVDSIATGPTSYLGYGAKIGLYYNYFLGLLDEANTWNRALTPSEVFSIYQSGLVGNESGLTALWHLDEGGGTIVEDATVNNYDGTLVGGVSFGPLSGLQAKVGDQKVTLLWNHSTEIDVLRYRIFRDTLPNPVVQIDSTTDSTITYTGLTNFKKYYFRVTIVDVSLNDTGYAGVSATPTNFSEVTGTGFINGADGNFMWGDYDNDGDYDVAIVGATDEYYPPFQNGFAKLYRHDNGDTFTEIDAQFQQEIHRSSVTWTDFNNDGLLDLAYAGSSGSGSRTLKLYKNNGNGTFSDVLHNMAGTALSAMAWGDYDNDGDQDLFLMGNDAGSGSQGSFLYRNDGNGEFNLVDTGIPGHANGSCAWGDYDNDNDLDLLVLGDGAVGFGIFLYRNDGNDSFADISANLPVLSIYRGQAVWGDYDNDGDLDIAFSGSTGGSGTRYASVYENNGDDTFTDINPGLTGLARAAVVWGDFDNDGDLDLFMTGTPTDYTGRQSYIARNNGGGSFVMIDIGIEPIFGGDQYTPGAAFIDYDRDGDLDVMVEGVDINNNYVTKLYKNGGSVLNVPPSDPTNLATTTSLDTVSFSWNKSTDNETPQNGLTYNLRVGKTPAGVQVMPPLAKVVDSGNTGGFRLIQAMGNTGHSNSWKLWDLADGTYYWSVESIDQIYRNSKFQAEQSFTIDGIPSAPIGLVAASNVSSVNLQWSPVNKSDVTKYYIWASDNNDTYYLADSTATTGKTITTLDGSTPLQNGAIYYFYIMAVDNNGYESPYSSTVSAIPSATPGKWFVTHPGDDSEGGTLREIIDSTNLSTQSDTIVFKIPRGSVISLYSSLQAISTDFTVIDGDSNADGIPDIMVVNSSFGDVMTVT